MKIGIDIDNVISSFDNELLKEYLKHDKELRGTGIINENADYIRRGMFDWSEDEELSFYKENIERIAKNLKPIKDTKKYIDKLKEDGNEIYIISGRDNNEYTNPWQMTKDWLEKYSIKYDKLILTNAYNTYAKTEECKKNNIDIMIEDSVRIASDLKQNGINLLLRDTRFNKNAEGFERASEWNKIYQKISSMYEKQEVEKINIILDTDTDNECDDQFALSYMIKSQDRFNIEAITIAPYQHDNDLAIEEGQEKSYQEAVKICNWLNFDTSKVYKGSNDYFTEGYREENDAVNKIIEVANKNDKTYIIAIGAITNVALAITKCPEIINKIEIVWLGGNSIINHNNLDFNFRQDIEAVRTVFNSKVKLNIIPCKTVAYSLMTSIYEVEHYLKGKNELCDYLCNEFHDDGKHGIHTRRPIWDISAVAYLINRNWFETIEISCPEIMEDTSYKLTENNHKITMATFLDSSKIYEDLFKKLGE